MIVLVAAIRGAVKGIGDTVVRMLCIIGSIGLGVFFSDDLKAYLMKTKMSSTLNSRIFELIRGEDLAGEAAPDDGVHSLFGSILTPGDSGEGVISKSLSGIFSDVADKTAEAMAERLTEVMMAVIAFALIVLAVGILAFIIRIIIKSVRESSVVLGFADRTLGFVLGVVRGLMLAWIGVALLIPLTTLISPGNVPAMMEALQHTMAAKVLYDVNPLLLLIRYVFM